MWHSPCFNRVSAHSIEVWGDNIGILFLHCSITLFFFYFSYIKPSKKSFKLETRFLFSCYIGRSPVMCSLFRPANSVDRIRRIPVKTYLSHSLNLIYKYLGFDYEVKLNFLPRLLFWVWIQFEFTHIKWNNGEMGFTSMRIRNIVKSNNHR